MLSLNSKGIFIFVRFIANFELNFFKMAAFLQVLIDSLSSVNFNELNSLKIALFYNVVRLFLLFLPKHIKGSANRILPIGFTVTRNRAVEWRTVLNITCFIDTAVMPSKKLAKVLHVFVNFFIHRN